MIGSPASSVVPLASPLQHSHRPTLQQLAAAFLIVGWIVVAILSLDFRDRPTFESGSFFFFLYSALVYYLGYFHYVPEVLGGRRSVKASLPIRWLRFLRTSGLSLLCIGIVAFAIQGFESNEYNEIRDQLLSGLLFAYLIATAFFILRRLSPAPEATALQTEKTAGVRRIIDCFGIPSRWIANRLKPRFCISWGSLAVLFSLLLIVSQDYGCGEVTSWKGYEVLGTAGSWFTATNITAAKSWDTGGRAAYALVLLVAVVAIAKFSRFTVAKPIHLRELRMLVSVIGWATLYLLIDFAICVWDYPVRLWILFGGLPMLVWIWKRHTPEWPLVRGAMIIFYLPILCTSYVMMGVPLLWQAYGFVLLFFGAQLLWWGLVQLSAEAGRQLTEKSQST